MSIKSEEFEKWRPEVNSGEENSPILSQREEAEDVVTTSISETAMSAAALEGTSSFYITLAKESPQRIFQDSDESTYDSYHCRETDVCRDSTDLDDSDSGLSFHAIMEVVEYEVASINGDEALYSNDSSSGGDDFFLTTISTKSIRQLKNCNSDFADTEYSNSDNNYDPELGLADYWKCVKCKNRQNNPMFRYCERCYQIRKSHFPPRPRKCKLKRKRNFSSSICEPAAVQNSCQPECERQSVEIQANVRNGTENGKRKFQTDTGHNKYKKRKLNYSTNNNSGERNSSATETSSENCSTESSDTDVENTSNSGRQGRKRKITPKIKGSASHRNNSSSNSSSTKNKVLHLSEAKGKTSLVEVDDRFVNNVENTALSSAIKCSDHENNRTQSPCIPLLSQKDSGFSSVPASSQEMPSSSQSDDPQILNNNRYLEHNDDDDDDSDSTIIENLNNKHMNECQKNHLKPLIKSVNRSNQIQFNRVSRSYSDFNIEKVSSVKRSTSNCSEILLNNNSQKNANQNNLSSLQNINSNGSIEIVKTNLDTTESDQCVVCLSEPKNGAFIHTKFAHLCCCYRCAVKIWNTRKKCPICNCSVKNVLKLFVH